MSFYLNRQGILVKGIHRFSHFKEEMSIIEHIENNATLYLIKELYM